MINRRQFLETAVAATCATSLTGESSWGGSVLDIHLHPRAEGRKEIDHLEGAGVDRAVLLGSDERGREVKKHTPAASPGSPAAT